MYKRLEHNNVEIVIESHCTGYFLKVFNHDLMYFKILWDHYDTYTELERVLERAKNIFFYSKGRGQINIINQHAQHIDTINVKQVFYYNLEHHSRYSLEK